MMTHSCSVSQSAGCSLPSMGPPSSTATSERSLPGEGDIRLAFHRVAWTATDHPPYRAGSTGRHRTTLGSTRRRTAESAICSTREATLTLHSRRADWGSCSLLPGRRGAMTACAEASARSSTPRRIPLTRISSCIVGHFGTVTQLTPTISSGSNLHSRVAVLVD